jgi:hypothetical protein
LILKDVIIEKKIKIFNIAVLYLLLFACFFYMALYPGSLQTLALKRMQYIGVGGGGVETGRADSGQQTGDNGDRWESRQQTFRVADRKEIQSKKRL